MQPLSNGKKILVIPQNYWTYHTSQNEKKNLPQKVYYCEVVYDIQIKLLFKLLARH